MASIEGLIIQVVGIGLLIYGFIAGRRSVYLAGGLIAIAAGVHRLVNGEIVTGVLVLCVGIISFAFVAATYKNMESDAKDAD